MKRMIVAAIISLAIVSTAGAVDVLKLETQIWHPYQFSNKAGVAVDAVKCVLDEMGQPYEIKVNAWARAQLNVKKGKAHGFFAASNNAKRNVYATQSDPFIRQRWAFYVLKEDAGTLSTKESLIGKRGGARLNAATTRWLKNSGYSVDATPDNADSMIKMLLKNRMDFVMENTTVFEYYVSKIPGLTLDRFHRIDNIDKHLGVYFGNEFLADNPGFLKDFNAAIKKAKCSTIE